MSAKKDHRYLLVVTILTGRKFPLRPTESVRIDVRFDGQLLSSLAVPMMEEPVFDTDMAFRLSGKQLKDHKVQKTPIKIEVNKVNKKTKQLEKIGYQTLDLRSYAVEVGKPRFSWFPLLGAQASRGKPELHIGVSVDEDIELQNEAVAQAEFTRSARSKDYWKFHQAILVKNPDGFSYYQIGPSKDSSHIFLLTLTIGYASHLDNLFKHLSSVLKNAQFFFHYELIDNHFTTKHFDDSDSSDFAPEKVSIRIKSNPELLEEYFLAQKTLKIRLCQGEGNILAESELKFEDIFIRRLEEKSETLLVEKEFPLQPVAGNRYKIPENLHLSPEETPVIGVACEVSILQKNDALDVTRTLSVESSKPVLEETNKNSNNNHRPKSAKSNEIRSPPIFPHRSQSVHVLSNTADQNVAEQQDRRLESMSRFSNDDFSEPQKKKHETFHDEDRFEEAENYFRSGELNGKIRPELSHGGNSSKISPASLFRQQLRERADEEIQFKPDTRAAETQTPTSGEREVVLSQSTSEVIRKFVCTIYLYKLRMTSTDLSLRGCLRVFLRYKYPFFGSSDPIVTRPPVEIWSGQDTLLRNNALTQFTFGCSQINLLRAFQTAPLCMELWKAGDVSTGSYSQPDELLGQGKLRLEPLCRGPVNTMQELQQPYQRRLLDTTLDIIHLQAENYPKMAELTVCCTLDDYGPVQHQRVEMIHSAPSMKEPGEEFLERVPRKAFLSESASAENIERKATLELESWKAKEEMNFRAQLRKREEDMLKTINTEWEQRTKQQKAFVDDNARKYKDLEEELRKMLSENSQKETILKEREKKVAEAESFVKSEQERLTADIEKLEKNVIAEYTKRLELEHSAQALLRAEARQLRNQLNECASKLVNQENELAKLKDLERQRPTQERELQALVDRLKLDKSELEHRFETITEAKEHYKQQWGVALKELAKLRDRLETEHERCLAVKDKQLEDLRNQLSNYVPRSHVNKVPEPSKEYYSNGLTKQFDYQQNANGDHASKKKHRLAIKFNGGTSNGKGHETDGTDDNLSDLEDLNGDLQGLGLSRSPSIQSISSDEMNATVTSRLAEALEQRNTLLQTGVYKPRDSAIVEMDKKIADLQVRIKKNSLR